MSSPGGAGNPHWHGNRATLPRSPRSLERQVPRRRLPARRRPCPDRGRIRHGPSFRGTVYATAFASADPQTNGLVERFFGTLKYEQLYRAGVPDGDALTVEVAWCRQIYNTVRPHLALHDRTTQQNLPEPLLKTRIPQPWTGTILLKDM
ncbi:integrase core domain-containing protein [Antrihabitans sp. YC2-6]|uniref:integrase core domain-containing protein n=1 Tax=Antrihabitans sp. YC2-6 TaxID=2799498 RepID=UPI0035A88AF7